MRTRIKLSDSSGVKHWEIIADDLRKAGWRCGCISSTDHEGRQFWVVAAERSDAGRFIVQAGEVLAAFMELEAAIRTLKNTVADLILRSQS